MSKTWKSIRRIPTLTAAVLLVSVALVAATPCAAAPAEAPNADSAVHVGPAWSGLLGWSLTEWIGEAIDGVRALWEKNNFTADPDGQSSKAMYIAKDLAPSKPSSNGSPAERVFR